MSDETKDINSREDLLFELMLFIFHNVSHFDGAEVIIEKYRDAWENLKFSWED